MKIYDISMIIENEMGVYKNLEEKKPIINFVKEMPKDSINESIMTMNLHTGTHIDAPLHIFQGGDTIEKVDLNKLITKCRVIDLTQVEDKITKVDLVNKELKADEFLLFKTKNSFYEGFSPEFIYLDRSGAEYLCDLNIKGVGTDAYGIERAQADHATHKLLFSKQIIVIEGIRLKDVPEGEYTLCALPLKIKGVDGAPARVVLIEDFQI